jgi:long-chain acyl-CoA synthetase
MTFIEDIFERIDKRGNAPVLQEVRDGQLVSVSAAEFFKMVWQARGFLVERGLKPGDRCVLLAPNSIQWVALDLAIMAEGLIFVPLYARQAPAELVGMMKDSAPSLIFCAENLVEGIRKLWTDGPEIVPIGAAFENERSADAATFHHADADPVTIIYTSGTSGEPKGVILNAGNVSHMLWCTNGRLDQLMGQARAPRADQIFHYLPFCFAGSWILLLTALSRPSVLTMSTDLNKLAEELKIAAPDYFLNVPTLLERVRTKVEEVIAKRDAVTRDVFCRAKMEYTRRQNGRTRRFGALCLWLADKALFPAIRKNIGGLNLRALICGSAPLSPETQHFFMMLGLAVLQVYGLTETTAICTMDDPSHFEPGRVGPAIPGIEMKLAKSGEILVRGPNVFPGYWHRPEETSKALDGGWFHTGDQGEVDSTGNWQITGRLKNLIILNSGHNIAPEPIEDQIAACLPEAQQVMLVGNQRSFLAAIVTAGTNGASNGSFGERIQSVLNAVNAKAPHYKQIRAFHVVNEPFTIEGGLLTANGKLKRDVIAARFACEIESLYEKRLA